VTEPDEALKFAEAMMRSYDHPSDVVIPPTGPLRIDGRKLVGIEAHNVTQAFVHAYRAGQAASAERIKALEGLLNHAEDLFDWAAQSDCENGVRSLNEAAAATYLADAPATKAAILEIRELTRAMLKEADQ
jgi:hypothetical protein